MSSSNFLASFPASESGAASTAFSNCFLAPARLSFFNKWLYAFQGRMIEKATSASSVTAVFVDVQVLKSLDSCEYLQLRSVIAVSNVQFTSQCSGSKSRRRTIRDSERMTRVS